LQEQIDRLKKTFDEHKLKFCSNKVTVKERSLREQHHANTTEHLEFLEKHIGDSAKLIWSRPASQAVEALEAKHQVLKGDKDAGQADSVIAAPEMAGPVKLSTFGTEQQAAPQRFIEPTEAEREWGGAETVIEETKAMATTLVTTTSAGPDHADDIDEANQQIQTVASNKSIEMEPVFSAEKLKLMCLNLLCSKGSIECVGNLSAAGGLWARLCNDFRAFTAPKDLLELEHDSLHGLFLLFSDSPAACQEKLWRLLARCLLDVADDPAKKEALKRTSTTLAHVPIYLVPSDKPLWIVVGGVHTQGICVRRGYSTLSPKLPAKLQTGSLVQEVDIKGFRLNFTRLFGEGPDCGWVSIEVHERGATQSLLVVLL